MILSVWFRKHVNRMSKIAAMGHPQWQHVLSKEGGRINKKIKRDSMGKFVLFEVIWDSKAVSWVRNLWTLSWCNAIGLSTSSADWMTVRSFLTHISNRKMRTTISRPCWDRSSLAWTTWAECSNLSQFLHQGGIPVPPNRSSKTRVDRRSKQIAGKSFYWYAFIYALALSLHSSACQWLSPGNNWDSGLRVGFRIRTSMYRHDGDSPSRCIQVSHEYSL